MYIYSHTFLVDATEMMNWLDYTTQILYKDLQNSENYKEFVFSKVNHDAEDSYNFNLQVYLKNKENLLKYEQNDLLKLQEKIISIFGDKVFFFSTYLEVIARL